MKQGGGVGIMPCGLAPQEGRDDSETGTTFHGNKHYGNNSPRKKSQKTKGIRHPNAFLMGFFERSFVWHSASPELARVGD